MQGQCPTESRALWPSAQRSGRLIPAYDKFICADEGLYEGSSLNRVSGECRMTVSMWEARTCCSRAATCCVNPDVAIVSMGGESVSSCLRMVGDVEVLRSPGPEGRKGLG